MASMPNRHLFAVPVLAALMLLSALPAFAQEDAEGAKDHPSIARMAGFALANAEVQEFATFDFQIGNGETRTVEGRYWRLEYWIKEGAKHPGPLSIARNYSNAFAARKGKREFEEVSPGGGTSSASMPLGDGRALWIYIIFS